MAEVTTAAYEDIRAYIEANWDFLEPYDDGDSAITRVDTSDDRITWVHADGAQTLQLEGVFSGDDSDITLPVTFAGSRVFDVDSGGSAYSDETYTNFTMEATDDEITITHEIEVPEVV